MGVMERARARPALAAGIALAAIVVASALLRIFLSRNVPGPWIFVDELIYSELGRSAFTGFEIRGVPVTGYGNVYPFIIAPAYEAFSDLVSAYSAVKVINAVVMSLTAIPAYFIARTLMQRSWSLVAAALTVLVPSMAYTGLVMTENAFYPAFALAMLLVIRALQRPTIFSQIFAFAGAVLCYEVRPQGALVLPAFVVSVLFLVVLDAAFAPAGSRLKELLQGLKRFLPTWIISGVGAAAFIAIQQTRGTGISGLLGAYAITAEYRDRYQAKSIISWFLLHIGELDLWLGVIPFIALLVLIGVALSKTSDRSVRVFACAVVPVMLMMTAIVAAFVVFANVTRIEERNLFYIGFFALIALCWWVSKGLERKQPRWFVIAVAVGAIGPVALPFQQLLTTSAVSDTFGVFIPYAIHSRLQDPVITTFLVAAGTIVMVGVILIFVGRRAFVAVAIVAGFLVITGAAVDRRTDKASTAATAISAPQNWVDRAVGSTADVAVIFAGGSDPMRVWQAEFFNRSIGPVFTIGTPLAGGLPDTIVDVGPEGAVIDRANRPVSSGYVLTDSFTGVDGVTVARDAAYGMVLIETKGPLRVVWMTGGIYGDGWSGADVTYTRFACTGGVVSMESSVNASVHPTPVMVTPFVGDVALPPTTVSSDVGSVQVPARLTPVDGVCQVRFHVDPVVIPSEVIGTSDTRPLGVIVRGFSYQPPA
jgi:hypothetical protein